MRLRRPPLQHASQATLAALAVLCAPALVLVPIAVAWGDDATEGKPAADAGAATRHDPDNKTALAEWMDRCIKGNAKYLAHDVPGAIDLYRQAIQLAPKKPLPHYLLGEALLGAGNVPEAESALNDAEQTSDDRDPNVRGKILFVLADLKEREKKWDDAKAAWKTYADYAAKHVDAGMAPSTPPARIQAIDDMLKQDKAYDVVRERIADEAKAASAPPDASTRKK
ncbi:MAG: tetratricopeptide repeat protein [Polyangiaceae bacterium]|jgi:tetratricopeptide (TPR) repeat protein